MKNHYHAATPRIYEYNIRLTKSEFEKLESLSEMAGMNRAQFIRMCLFEKKIIIVPNTKEIVNQILKIGTNVNQIAHRINAELPIDLKNELKDVQTEFKQIKKILLEILKGNFETGDDNNT